MCVCVYVCVCARARALSCQRHRTNTLCNFACAQDTTDASVVHYVLVKEELPGAGMPALQLNRFSISKYQLGQEFNQLDRLDPRNGMDYMDVQELFMHAGVDARALLLLCLRIPKLHHRITASDHAVFMLLTCAMTRCVLLQDAQLQLLGLRAKWHFQPYGFAILLSLTRSF